MYIKSIHCVNFRAFEDREFEFGRVNYIDGDNYQGKTSIAEAIVALMLGTTVTGSPQLGELIRNGAKKFELTGVIETDDGEHEIYRSRDSRKTTIQIDGNPATQAQIDALVGSKERFLAVFVPGYFASLSNPSAREMLVALTKRPKPMEIIVRLEGVGDRLTMKNPKKLDGDVIPVPELRDPDKFMKDIRSDIKANEAERNRIDGRISVFHEQLKQQAPDVVEFDDTELKSLRAELETIRAAESSQKLQNLYQLASQLGRELENIELEDIPSDPYQLGEPCPVCQRPFDVGSLVSALEHHLEHVEQLQDSNAVKAARQVEIQEQIRDIESQISTLETELYSDYTGTREHEIRSRISELESAEYEATAAKAKHEQIVESVRSAADAINKSENDKAELERESFELGERLKAVAAYRQELVKMQVDSIRKYLSRVDVKLFKVTQDGEIKDDFELTYDGKDYKILSHSEKIRVNLEIASLFNKALGLEFPVFLDDAESITHFETPVASQLFLAKVVKGAALELETRDDELEELR